MTKPRASLGVFEETPPKQEKQGRGGVPSYRVGKVSMPFWIPKAAKRQLRVMAAEMETTQQQIVADAINDFFKKHGKQPIA
ncbi:MAG: hypothetical protein HQK96_09275 [Nitrospirae bacterium]|nr:hypothetical protein [Nitrospirota bacterium]